RLPGGTAVQKETLTFHRERVITSDAVDEVLTITNFNVDAIPLQIVIFFEADFQDIFELRGFVRSGHRGTLHPPRWEGDTLTFQYDGIDNVVRQTHVSFGPGPSQTSAGQATFQLNLGPHSSSTLHPRASIELSNGPPTE